MNSEEINDSLCHWGILKQKWGVRRYQNPDGTYTELGKIRKREARGYSDDYLNSRRKPESMSTEDLKKASDRYNAESNYENNKGNANTAAVNKTGKYIAAGVAVASAAIAGGLLVKTIMKARADAKDPLYKELAATRKAGLEAAAKSYTVEDATKDALAGIKATTVKRGAAYRPTTIEDITDAMKRIKMSDISDENDDVLVHHGILGMHWGVRRYQNPDGSLTPLGRKRYGVKTYAELTPAQKREANRLDKEESAREEQRHKEKLEAKAAREDTRRYNEELRSERKAEAEARRQIQAEKTVKAMAIGTLALTAVLGVGTMYAMGKHVSSQSAAKTAAKTVAQSETAKKGSDVAKIILTDRALPRSSSSNIRRKANIIYSSGPTVRDDVARMLPMLKGLPAPKK